MADGTANLEPGFPQMELHTNDHIMFYDLSSSLSLNDSANFSPVANAILNLGSAFITTIAPENYTVDDVTFLESFGRLPARSGRPQSFLSTLRRRINDSVVPAAIGVGIIGNILLVLVFMLSPLRNNAICHYLTALGVSDFIYLISCLVVWITRQGVNLQNTTGVCQITMFALMLFGFLDTWYLFAAHAERVIVQFGSSRAQKWCTTFRTKCIIIIIFVFSLVGFSHYMWVYVVTEWKGTTTCLLMHESKRHIAELGKVEVLVASCLPLLLIIVMDLSLFANAIAKCGKSCVNSSDNQKNTDSEWRGEYALSGEGVSRQTPTPLQDVNPPLPELDISQERTTVTVMVVIAGLIYIGLTLPSTIFRAKQYFTQLSRPSNKDMEIMLLAEEIVKFNSVYKVLLYFITLKSFRRGLVHLFTQNFWQATPTETLEQTCI